MLAEFSDPRLVAIYETVNAYDPGTQPDFYSDLAAEIGATLIVDLGCGTGLITRALAKQGYRMIGVDPAPAMIEIAGRAAHGDRVQWICGGASDLGRPGADLAIMTGHVAQFFLTDESWSAALTALHRALRPGGRLAFESRNPGAREWEAWTEGERRSAADATAGRIDTWLGLHSVNDGIVSYANHYLFATGEEIVVPGQLRFRSESQLTESLGSAGFEVERVYGDWDRRPASRTSPELIVVAVRREVDM